jgi:hypothetical protein
VFENRVLRRTFGAKKDEVLTVRSTLSGTCTEALMSSRRGTSLELL